MNAHLRAFDKGAARIVELLPAWVDPIMRGATFIGLPAVIVTLAAVIAYTSWLKGKYRIAYAMFASVGGLVIGSLIKLAVQRDRPLTLYAQNMKIQSYSFPSGHAVGSVVFYGLLAYLAYCYLPQPWNYIAAGLLSVLVILIGLSRIYLGAHFPSDVIGGWVLGGIFLFLIIKYIRP